MQSYENKESFVNEIKKTASLFIKEFDEINPEMKDLLVEGVDRTPHQMIAYQLGWICLLKGWEEKEQAGILFQMPDEGLKWNQTRLLHERFYQTYQDKPFEILIDLFNREVNYLIEWINILSEDELFKPEGRKWAASTTSNWPIYKWVHINTVAPFKSFRTKIRKWKRLMIQK